VKEIEMKHLRLNFLLLILVALFALAGLKTVQGQVGGAQGLVNPDVAGEKELLALPHMNAALVKRIMAERPFSSMTKLNALLSKSLSTEQLSELYGKMFVPINLNTASDEDILSIPGVGKRMLREFKEYRPYTNIEQFRKEIGKYVDNKEVARLERYVTLN
jgi:DNA uptake protein ComE-like DNA-binding protein